MTRFGVFSGVNQGRVKRILSTLCFVVLYYWRYVHIVCTFWSQPVHFSWSFSVLRKQTSPHAVSLVFGFRLNGLNLCGLDLQALEVFGALVRLAADRAVNQPPAAETLHVCWMEIKNKNMSSSLPCLWSSVWPGRLAFCVPADLGSERHLFILIHMNKFDSEVLERWVCFNVLTLKYLSDWKVQWVHFRS